MRGFINRVHDQVFDEGFYGYLKKRYDKMVRDGLYVDVENNRAKAQAYFAQNWSQEQMNTIESIEQKQKEKIRYAAEHAFCCGFSAAFEQLFAPSKDLRNDFSERVHEGLYCVDGMKRHPYYLERSKATREMYDSLADEQDETLQYHLTSHECAWDERNNNAALEAYYCGYRMALELIDRVRPLASQRMIDQILTMEYSLGITLPKAQRELQKRKGEADAS